MFLLSIFRCTMLKPITVLLLLAAMANSQCFYKDDSSKKLNPEARTSLYKGQLAFTLNLFNAINNAVPDDNIFFSPFSIYHSLLLAYFSAGGLTEELLRKSLEIENNMVSSCYPIFNFIYFFKKSWFFFYNNSQLKY